MRLSPMLALIIPVLAVLGCAASGRSTPDLTPPTYDLYLNPSIDADTGAAVVSAAEDWTTMTGAIIQVHSGSFSCTSETCFNVFLATEYALQAYNDDSLESEEIDAQTGPNMIAIWQGLDPLKIQWAATHEIGHALGLGHPCGVGVKLDAVMNPAYGFGSLTVTALDVAQYRTVD
jgi:Matrixin